MKLVIVIISLFLTYQAHAIDFQISESVNSFQSDTPPADGTFNPDDLEALSRHSGFLIHHTNSTYGSKLSSTSIYLLRRYHTAAQQFVGHCYELALNPPEECWILLNDTWNAYFPINPATGRLRGKRGEFPLLFRELDAIDRLLNKITYGK